MQQDLRIDWWINRLKSGQYDGFRDRLQPDLELQPEYAGKLTSGSREVEVLDVFSGPLTSLGNRLAGRTVKITQLEPQAERLASLMKACSLTSRGNLIKGGVEQLEEFWPAPAFDLVVCRQAGLLSDPLKDIPALLGVVRPGGYLTLTASFGSRADSADWSLHLSRDGLVLRNQDEDKPIDALFAGDEVELSWRATSDANADAMGWLTIEVHKRSTRSDRIRRELEDFDSTARAIEQLYEIKLEDGDLAFIADFFARKPEGTAGSILPNDAAFLFSWMKMVRPVSMLEIGVSSGVSSAFLIEAADRLGLISQGFRLDSLDLLDHVYAAPEDKVGWVVDRLPSDLRASFNLITGVTSNDLESLIEAGRISQPDLVFLDAEHAHPFPCIDLEALCDATKENTWLLLHDISLFERALRDSFQTGGHPDWMLRGAQWAFEFWPGEKFRGAGEKANVGAVRSFSGLRETNAWRAIRALPHERSLTPEAGHVHHDETSGLSNVTSRQSPTPS